MSAGYRENWVTGVLSGRGEGRGTRNHLTDDGEAAKTG